MQRRLVLVAAAWLLAGCPRDAPTGSPEPNTQGPAPDVPSDVAVSDTPEMSPERAPRERPAPSAVHSREAAIGAVDQGNVEGGRDFLKGFVGEHPDDVDALRALARAHTLLGEFDAAEAVHETLASAKTPIARNALLARAEIAWRRGDNAGAAALTDQAHKLDPKDARTRGEVLWHMVRTGSGEDAAARALMDGLYDSYDMGEITSASDHLGVAYATIARGTGKNFHDANFVLSDAEELEPVAKGTALGERLLLLHAAIFREKYASGEAADTLGMILAHNPWHTEALAELAMVRLDQLDLAGASISAREALSVDPEHPTALAALARVALVEGRRAEAKAYVTRALARNPLHTEALAVSAASAIFLGNAKGYSSAKDSALKRSSTNSRFFTSLSDLMSFLHLYPEIDEVLREGAKAMPEDPYIEGAFGLNALRLGKEDEGRAAIEHAYAKDPFNERTANTHELYTKRIDAHYVEKTRGAITIRLPSEDAELVSDDFFGAIGRAKSALDKAYAITPDHLRVEIFESPEDFSIRTMGVPSLGAVGVCFGETITSIGPYSGQINFDQVIWHEIAHTYAIDLSKGRVPRWFTEGLSEWESEVADPSWARESAELLAEARRRGKMRKLSELELAFLRAGSPTMMEVAYATAAWAMRFLGETQGREKIAKVLRGYAKGGTTDDLFQKHFGKTVPQLEREFETWFDAELDRRVSGWVPSPPKKGGEPSSEMKAFEKAMSAAGGGDHEAALEMLEKLVAEGADGYSTRLAIGKVAKAAGDDKAAKTAFEHAASFNKESTTPWVELALLARKADDLSAESHALEAALAIDAMSFEPAARLIMVAALEGDQKALQSATTRARALAPLHPITLSARALLDARNKKTRTRAEKLLTAASTKLARASGGPADTWVVAALAADALGDKGRAKDHASAATRRAKDSEPLGQKAQKRMSALGG